MCYGAVAFGLIDLAIFLYPLGYVAVWPAVAGMIVVGLPGALTLAGLVMLVWLKEEGEPASAPSQGEAALATADG